MLSVGRIADPVSHPRSRRGAATGTAARCLVALAALLLASRSAADNAGLWSEYKKQFIQLDGRVIDYRQNQISHSEGQGYAMLLAVVFNDRATFERLANWTANNLQVRNDPLHAWSWGKRFNGNWTVLDYNNATDGDVLIAGALLKAAQVFAHEPFRQHALEIVSRVRSSLAMRWKQRTFLLPAYSGFVQKDHFLLNPSYLIFSLYRDFAPHEQRPFWERVYTDGLYLLDQSRFGRFQLPADWVRVEADTIRLDSVRGQYFGYEAIRTLLYLAWAGEAKRLSSLLTFLRWCQTLGYIPAKVNLIDNTISEDKASAGFYAVYALTAQQLGEKALSEGLWREARARVRSEARDYYSFSLFLLASNPP